MIYLIRRSPLKCGREPSHNKSKGDKDKLGEPKKGKASLQEILEPENFIGKLINSLTLCK